jgi:hypothetical protein
MASAKLLYHGRINEQGEVILPRSFRGDLAKAFAGREITVTVERRRKKRSDPLNAYYWAVVIPHLRHGLEDCSGDKYTSEQVHEAMKHRFLRQQVVDEHGQVVMDVAGSSAALTNGEFLDYLERLSSFALEYLNTRIPLPNESGVMIG